MKDILFLTTLHNPIEGGFVFLRIQSPTRASKKKVAKRKPKTKDKK